MWLASENSSSKHTKNSQAYSDHDTLTKLLKGPNLKNMSASKFFLTLAISLRMIALVFGTEDGLAALNKAEKHVYDQIERMPQTQFNRLHSIYMSKQLHPNDSWERIIATQFEPCTGCIVFSLMNPVMSEAKFEHLYDKRIKDSCDKLRSIYESSVQQLQYILEHHPQVFEATKIATVRYMAESHCDKITKPDFRKRVYYTYLKESDDSKMEQAGRRPVIF